MQKILVPTDFSEGAFNALKYAVTLAKKYNSTIEVVNAFAMPATGTTVMVDITQVLEKNSREALDSLREKVEAEQLQREVDITYKAIHGDVVSVVNRVSKASDIDLVVMGTQGASGITEKWLGTNTFAAAKNVEKPLWAIPAERTFHTPRNILFATDMKVMDNTDPLHFVADLAERFDAEVNFLHVRDDDEDPTADNRACKEQIRDVFDDRKPSFSYVEDDDIDDGIEKAVKSENPDLLVVVRHSYGFFQNLFRSSVSREVINAAKLPILVLRG